MSASLPRIITIMGSGETSPTMIKTHRDVLARLGSSPSTVILDTPYGFQENAHELVQRAVDYFRQSVGHDAHVAGLKRLKSSGAPHEFEIDDVSIEQGLNRVRDAQYVFAGPGSPTYALQQWAGSSLPDILISKVRDGGAVTFSSAAALTLGRFTVPVYEIYKVGLEPHWLDGLDILSEIGLQVAIIPHFDNAEGGHHDTRFCYLGERRLRVMEDLLGEDAHIIGIDEHTGLVIDLDSSSAAVVGNGCVTVRVRGVENVFDSGTSLPVDALREPRAGAVSFPTVPPTVETARSIVPTVASLGAETDKAVADFERALGSHDAGSAVRAVLELEGAIHRWSADTLQSDDSDRARATLRSMIVRLGDAASSGLVDPQSVVGPFVEALLELRTVVRSDKRYDLSDLIRDRLIRAGVDVHDTPDGATWELRSSQG